MSEERTFAPVPGSVGEARRFAEGLLSSSCPAGMVTSAVLMVSELATNAIKHAGSGFSMRVEVSAKEVRVEVGDAGRGMPVLRSPQVTEPSGRGLRIVELLADAWGVESTPEATKRVWFRLRRAPAPRGASADEAAAERRQPAGR